MGRIDRHIKILSWPRAFVRVLFLYLIFSLIAVIILGYYFRDLPSIEQLQNFDPELVTRIYSADGIVLQELYTQRRIFVPMEKIPPAMVHAVIAIEDARFMQHWGFSLRDFTRALIIDILTLSKDQGASTLTQQLARLLYDNIGFEKTIARKIKEFLTALQIERMYTKSEIAEMYINTHWMGNGAYGIQAAAKRYFNKTADKLTPAECALLAGQIKNSVRFSPFRRPINAFQRRNLVLRRMMEKGFLDEEELAIYRNTPLQVMKPDQPPTIAPYFVEHVRQWLQKEDEKLDIDIYRDGLSIYTTLDTRIQSIADSALLRHLVQQQGVLDRRLLNKPKELEQLLPDTSMTVEQIQAMIRGDIPYDPALRYSLLVQGALVAIEPATGHILAMVGGRDFKESEFNRATQARRQPGSVFKPIVYATAIDNGIPVTQSLLNQPVVIDMRDGTRWAPKNYDLSTGGPTTLREGLRRSLNLVSARVVLELISPASVVETAHRMHLSTYMPSVVAISLGSAEVIPLEMTAAYGIFCNNGIWVEPIAVTRIEDRYGNPIAEYSPTQDLVFNEETAYLTTNLLQTVIDEGTGKNTRLRYGFRQTAAGKTGTTNDFTDAWFLGFTPHIVTGVWIGVDNPAVSLGDRQAGAVAALPVWARFMRETHRVMGWKDQSFVRPSGIIDVRICKETKLLPSKFCPTETELFIQGTEPVDECPIHKDIEEKKELDRVIF